MELSGGKWVSTGFMKNLLRAKQINARKALRSLLDFMHFYGAASMISPAS